MRGEEPSDESVNKVNKLPKGFTDWVKDNKKRIAAATKSGTLPYFLKDNEKYKEAALENISILTAAQTRYDKLVTNELKVGGSYLVGMKHKYSADFFALIDPNKPIKLDIINDNSNSYSTWNGDLVHIANKGRRDASEWFRTIVIYHEYGHCIDAQRNLWQDSSLISMRNKQIAWLHKRTDDTLYMQGNWNYNTHTYDYVKKKFPSRAAYIDERLKQLNAKISAMDETIFTKRGITKADVIEQILSTRDTLKSLITKYGYGHSSSYFAKTRMKETEYLAHAFENAFV